MRDTAGKARTKSCDDLQWTIHMDVPVLADLQQTYPQQLRADTVWWTYQA